MLVVLRNRSVALLWTGGLISTIGDWLLIIAIPFYVFQVTGSTLATGSMYIVQMAPGLVLGSLAGVFVDRWDRRRTMIVVDLVRAILLLPLLHFHAESNLWILYSVAAGLEIASRFFGPARGALLPRLVDATELKATNALLGIGDEAAMLIGAPLGGALLAAFGLSGVVVLDAGSFVVSALLISFVGGSRGSRSAKELAVERRGTPWVQVRSDFIAGLRLVRTDRVLVSLMVSHALEFLGQGLIVVLWVVFFQRVLHGDSLGYGAVQTAVAVGTITGGILTGTIGRRVPAGVAIGVGGVATGALLLATFNLPVIAAFLRLGAPLLPIVLIIQVVQGIPAMWSAVSMSTLLQEATRDEFRGRVIAIKGMLSSFCLLVGTMVASGMGDQVGVTKLLDVAGILFVLSGVAGFCLLAAAASPSNDRGSSIGWSTPGQQ